MEEVMDVITLAQDDAIVKENTNIDNISGLTPEQIELLNSHNDRIIRSPEYQAMVIYENYMRTAANPYMDGPAKKRLRKEILRNAKKGKYKKIFTEEYIEETKRIALEEFIKTGASVPETIEPLMKKDL